MTAETMDTTPLPPTRRPVWLRDSTTPPLADVFRSIPVRASSSGWRRFLAFVGPGYLVAVGYMDPGNWATSLAGGSQFGYALLTVALLSNIMAILLQSLCARLAIATGKDLAQACRDAFRHHQGIAASVRLARRLGERAQHRFDVGGRDPRARVVGHRGRGD